VPALLWQIGPLETCLHSQAVSLPGRFARLMAHLRQFYPARHEVVAIHCSPHPIVPARILRFALEDMGGHAAEIHGGFTLYVPPGGGGGGGGGGVWGGGGKWGGVEGGEAGGGR